MYAISHYGFEINSVDENSGELNRISVIPFEGNVDDIEKIGNNVFVSVSSNIRWQGEILSALYKIEVSNPYEPVVVDSIIFPENIQNYVLRTYGGYLVYHKLEEISDDWIYTQLVFVDPITFNEIISFPIDTFTIPLRENYFLKQRNLGEYIFDVYDYTDIYNIHIVSSVDFGTCPTAFLLGCAIDDSTFVLMGDESISIYDISDLSDIQLVSTYFRYNNVSLFCLFCMKIDNFLLIPSQSVGIEVVDITDIENPILFDFWEYPIDELSLIDPHFITLAGIIYDNGHLYVGSYYHGILLMNYQGGMLEYVDNFINNRTNKVKFQIFDNYLITSGFSRGLYVYDIENVNSPELITILFEDLYVLTYEIINEHIYLIILMGSNYYFRIYCISDISNPILNWDELLIDSSNLIMNVNEPDNIYFYLNTLQSVEIRKYDIEDPGNIEQIMFYEYPAIIYDLFFYEGYLYAVGSYENGGSDLFIFDGFEEEDPELVNQINNFVNGFNIQIIDSYLNTSPSSPFEKDSFYNLDDPINPEFAFTIQNTSVCFNNYYINNVLFSPCYYTVFLYDLENNPTGELEPFDHFNLNSEYRGISFFSQGENDYFFCEQLECISTYSYILETSAEDELPKPELTISNYPNPFNPETKIVFNLPEEGNVKLEIYNIKGQKIITLLDCYMSPGRSEMIWNGKDDNGKPVGSGVYFYKLQTPSKSYVRKCMLLK